MTITTENLAKRFNREWIFRKFSFQFQTGNRYAITGPNGAGKSTLLQVLAGVIPPSDGNLFYKNQESIVDIEDVYKHLTFASPYLDLIEEFTLKEHLNFHFKMKKSRNGLQVNEIIDLMYLQKATDKRISDFSSGMKQRLKLGLAFFTEADIIFLDEPGSNLDKTAFEWYLSNLSKVEENCIVFIASNNQEEYPKVNKVINIMDFK